MKTENLDQPIIEGLDRSLHVEVRGDLGLAGNPASSFVGNDFSGKKFKNNNFAYTSFENCNLTSADFTENNNLHGAQFVNSNVAGANFRGTKVRPEQFIQAINFTQADFDNNTKMYAQIEKLAKIASRGGLNRDFFLYRLYRWFIRILGGNAVWYTEPPKDTKYIIPMLKDTNKVIDFAIDFPKQKVNS